MTRAFNFSAGPATLPESVLRQAQAEMLEWNGVGASIVEISHRSADFMQVAAQAEADLRTLVGIPDDYAVLFLSGGATTQQALLPLNLAAPGQRVDYVVSGHWGKTAVKQARPYVDVNIAADGEADIGRRQSRRVIDAIPHEGDPPAAGLKGANGLHLAVRQNFGAHLVDAQTSSHGLRGPAVVAGDHGHL